MTPFLLDFACAFEAAPGVHAGPWDFYPKTATMTLYGQAVEPCGWGEMEALAAGDPNALRWLERLREGAERRLRYRIEHGSLWEPRP